MRGLSNGMGRDALGLIGWFVVCFMAAAVGAWASAGAGAFYGQLARPAWAPPAYLFGPVWTALYAMMALSAWLVWRRRARVNTGAALGLFIGQLAVNALWSWLFFAWTLGGAALVNIGILWCLIALTVGAFWPISRPAALLLLPYWGWVSFAGVLNLAVWRMNPALL